MFGSTGIFVRSLIAYGMSGTSVIFLRFSFAAIEMLIMILCTDGRQYPVKNSKCERQSYIYHYILQCRNYCNCYGTIRTIRAHRQVHWRVHRAAFIVSYSSCIVHISPAVCLHHHSTAVRGCWLYIHIGSRRRTGRSRDFWHGILRRNADSPWLSGHGHNHNGTYGFMLKTGRGIVTYTDNIKTEGNYKRFI